MAFTAQLGIALSRPGNIALGSETGDTPPTPPIQVVSTLGGGYPITQRSGRNSPALVNRDYRERELPKRITRVDATVTADGVVATARVGMARARGVITVPPEERRQDATVRAETVRASAHLGRTDRVNATARIGKRRMSADEWFMMGYLAGQDDGD